VETCHGLKVPKTGAYLRGLPFCPDCSKFLNRDRSAALNIRFLFTQTRLLGRPMPEQFAARYKKKAVSNQASWYTEGHVHFQLGRAVWERVRSF
jgi:transposase